MIIVIKEKSPYYIVILIKLIIKMSVFSNYDCPTNSYN